MRAVLGICLACGLYGTALAQPVAVEGHWEGQLDRLGQHLEISFDVSKDAEGPQVRFSADRWAVMDYPLGTLKQAADRVAISLGDTVLEGVVSADQIEGSFKGSEGSGTFALKRARAAALPYRTIPVSFGNGNVQLAGTLVMPSTRGRHAAVVLLHGSGAEVRWGTSRYIADRLARAGVAALIFDKRGSGQSSGDWRKASYEDLAADGIAAIDLLSLRADVDRRRIGLLGHSEGGIVASVAANAAPGKIAFLVSEDAPAMTIRDQDLYRVSRDIQDQVWKDDDKARAVSLYRVFLDAASGDRPIGDFVAAADGVKDRPWFRYLGLPLDPQVWVWSWYRSRAHLDTGLMWRTVRRPTLLVYGQRDRLMPVDLTVRRIEEGLDASHTPYAALIAPRAEHNLTVRPEPGEPFFWWRQAPGVIDTVAAWIVRCTATDGPCHVA